MEDIQTEKQSVYWIQLLDGVFRRRSDNEESNVRKPFVEFALSFYLICWKGLLNS